MSDKQKRELLHWLNAILQDDDKRIAEAERIEEEPMVPTSQAYKVGCVLRSLIEQI